MEIKLQTVAVNQTPTKMNIDIENMTLAQLRSLQDNLNKAIVGFKPAKLTREIPQLDWTKPNIELAREHGVSPSTIGHWRWKLGIPKVTKHWPACKEWDWSKPNSAIARENHTHPGVVLLMRQKLGHPPGPRDCATVVVPKPKKHDYSAVDWAHKTDVEISRELGVTRECIRQARCKLGLPKRLSYDLKYERFLEVFKDRESVSMSEAAKRVGICHSTFLKYLTRSGKTSEKSKRIHAGTIHPWHLINWDIPNILLKEIWGIGSIHTWRCDHSLPKPKFRQLMGVYPAEFEAMVVEERRKAEEYRASKATPLPA